MQYPKGKELKISMGEYLYKDHIYFAYSIGTENGTSGSPIILYDNMRIVGIHKGTKGNNKNKINIGISFNYIMNKINFIKCIYNIKDIKEDIKLINNKILKDNVDIVFNKYEINEEIENKMKININGKISSILFKTKFNKIGNHAIYFISKEPIKNLSFLFYECSSLKEINLSSFNTNNVTNMSHMFNGCSSLKEINLSSFNTNNVIDMSGMFNECSSLKEINLSSFNTNNVTNMSCMFSGCSSLKEINLSSFNTNNVTEMFSMFTDLPLFCNIIAKDPKLLKKIEERNKCNIF